MLILKNGKTVRNEIIDLVINGGIIEDIIIKQGMSAQRCSKEVDAVQDLQEIDSCGGFNPPAFCVVTKGIKADCNHIMRTTYPDARVGVVDLEGRLVMPGIIDLHTHMRDPGLTHKEDFYTGSRACAKGGITTFFDMPNTQPPTVTAQALTEKIAQAARVSAVNFGFHFGASKNNNIDEIQRVIDSGQARSTKVFMNVSTGLMLIEDTALLAEIFKTGGLVFVHAEAEMIGKAIELNARYGNGLYICHISSEEEMRTVIKAKQNPALHNRQHPIYAEVTPHHLFLHTDMREASAEANMLLRMKPELNAQSDTAFLMQAIRDGYVDTIGTDHAPHTLDEKLAHLTFGIPGAETSLALMLTAAAKGNITLPQLQKLMSENPAAILGLTRKGVLAKGADADITVADTAVHWQLNRKDIASKCGWSPFEGWNFIGKNYMTMVNGSIVYRDGRFTADLLDRPAGRFVFQS